MAAKPERFTADGQSTITLLSGVVFASTTADTLDLRAGGAGGTIYLTIGVAANGTTSLSFDPPIASPTGAWYADVTTTGAPKITLVGN